MTLLHSVLLFREIDNHAEILRLLLAKCFVGHLIEVKGRYDRVVELKPRLLIGLGPLATVIFGVTITLNIDIRDVMSGVSDAHVDDHSDELVLELLIFQGKAVLNKALKLSLLFKSSLALLFVLILLVYFLA